MALNAPKTDVILFVHGLSGTADGTWSKMIELFLRDNLFARYEIDTYEYPTSKIRVPLGRKMPGIPELAEGLASHLDTYHSKRENVILVGHSLGGLVLRYFIVSAFKKSAPNNIRAAAMIATPHAGADLARFGKTLSWGHSHLKQLVKGHGILSSILTDWASLEIETKIKTIYVTGGVDAVVSRESSMPYYGGVNFQNLINYGHVDVIKPEHSNDIRFKVLKKFVEELPSSKKPDAGPLKAQGWPLFFRYQLNCEDFYYIRRVDDDVEQALSGSNIWLSGPSGMGKTVALTRAIMKKDWSVYYFSLDGFLDLSAIDLMKEVCRQLMDRLCVSDAQLAAAISLAEVLRCFSSTFLSVTGQKRMAMFIEEIPIVSSKEYCKFLNLAYHLSMLQETCKDNLQVVWVFSSIVDPLEFSKQSHVKLLERYAFLNIGVWESTELQELFQLVDREVKTQFTAEETSQVIMGSKGSPRNLKLIVKNRLTEVGSKKSIPELISSVPVSASNE